jgi:hypothetical protein
MTSLNNPKDQPNVDRSFKVMLDLGIVVTAIQWALYVQLAWFS